MFLNQYKLANASFSMFFCEGITEHVRHKPCGPETEAQAENAHMKQEAGHSLCLKWLKSDEDV